MDARQRIEVAHDVLCAAKVGDGLEKGNDDQIGVRARIAEHALHEPALLLKNERFEKIADRFGVAGDVLPDGALAICPSKLASGIQDFKLARRL